MDISLPQYLDIYNFSFIQNKTHIYKSAKYNGTTNVQPSANSVLMLTVNPVAHHPASSVWYLKTFKPQLTKYMIRVHLHIQVLLKSYE